MEEGRRQLEADVIPQIKQSPGFVAAYFLAPPSGREALRRRVQGRAARAAAENAKPPEPVKLLNVEVREVAASA